MSAETLRRAASLMRERAEAATEGPWECAQHHYAWQVQTVNEQWAITMDHEGLSDSVEPENGEHIASWHPAVALAVADWLDACANSCPPPEFKQPALALTVARAYLGGDA